MQVGDVVRSVRCLVAERTRRAARGEDGRTWRWSVGRRIRDREILEAREYLASDADVEAIFLDVAHYGGSGLLPGRRWSGIWEPTDEAYRPHGLALEPLATRPHLAIEIDVPKRWEDAAVKASITTVRAGRRTWRVMARLVRWACRLVRTEVASRLGSQDKVSTHAMQARVSFFPEPGVDPKRLTEQLVRAGVLMEEAERPWGEKGRCLAPDGVLHLVHPSLTVPLCGGDPNARGGVFYSADGEDAPADSRLCVVCARMSAALSEPLVDPELWRSAPSWMFKDGPRVAQQDAPRIPDETDRESMGEALQDALNSDSAASCPGCSRAYGTEGVTCHRTPADGWVCEIAIKDHPLTQAGVSKITVPSPSVVQRHLIDTVKRNGGRARLSDLGALRGRFTSGQVWLALNYLLDEGLLLTGDGMYVLPPASPTPVEEASADTPPDLDDGDEMPILLVTFDARVYLPKLMVEAGMVTSQKNGIALISARQVTIDGKSCAGRLTFGPIELVGFVVELGGPGSLGDLPRVYESMTRRFRVMSA